MDPGSELQARVISSPLDQLETQVLQCSIKVCSANLVMSVLGAGQLTLAHCLQQLGIISGTLLMCGFALSSAYSMMILATCLKEVAASSYKELIQILLGTWAKRVLDALIVIYIWGGSVAFLIIVKQELGILAVLIGVDVDSRILLASIVLIVVWPLCMIRTLDRLKFASTLGVCSGMWITLVVLTNALFMDGVCAGAEDASQKVSFWPSSFLNAISVLPLLAFAFNGSWSFPTVYHSLAQKTTSRTMAFTSTVVSIISLNYLTIAVAGYLTYCNATRPDILDSLVNLPSWREGFVVFSRAALISQLCLAMPVRCNVFAAVFVPPPRQITRRQHVSLITLMVFSVAGVAMTSVELDVAIGLTSAVCASFIMYIFPAVCEAKQICTGQAKINIVRMCGAILMGSLGVFILVTGTYSNL